MSDFFVSDQKESDAAAADPLLAQAVAESIKVCQINLS